MDEEDEVKTNVAIIIVIIVTFAWLALFISNENTKSRMLEQEFLNSGKHFQEYPINPNH